MKETNDRRIDMGKIYHVSKTGKDCNTGTKEYPFLTIQKAADLMVPGDKVIVHEGEYREWVRPKCGGLHDNCRIEYEAAEGEQVIIKGSERIENWESVGKNVWKTQIPNDTFHGYNPYQIPIEGDWLISPHEYQVHVGDVYINGKSMFEAKSYQELAKPEKRLISEHETWGGYEEKVLEPDQSIYQWWASVDETSTTVYANFQEKDPNEELVEINVRAACFFPEQTGINYITVRGFEMAHAATMWAPPTANQQGLLGPNWSKGWIIENNHIHDSKCCGISLGKECTTGDNDYTKYGRKPGYQYQMEAVFRAIKQQGWSKERVGSHIVRNNMIHDCGQAGIVGHMGCAFSDIYNNEIYNISVKREFYGHELGGIKFHAAIDTRIHHNYIHHCSLGLWLDWQVQGVRVSSNIFDKNNRDLMIEVTHGPFIVDHNILTAEFSMVNAAQGGAYLHNIFNGFISRYAVMDRGTPYHYEHATDVLGTAVVYGGDDRWYHNVFVGGDNERERYGTCHYDGHETSLEEYINKVRALGWGDVEQYKVNKQPVYINNNMYMNGAKCFDREENPWMVKEPLNLHIETEDKEVYLYVSIPEEWSTSKLEILNTKLFPCTRISELRFENHNGEEIEFRQDLLGEQRNNSSIFGPLQNLKRGENRIKIWTRK